MCIQRRNEGGAFLDDTHPGMGVSVDASLVTFGLTEEALEIQVVEGEIEAIAAGKQPPAKARHQLCGMLRKGRPVDLERAVNGVERRSTAGARAVLRLQGRPDRADDLPLLADLPLERSDRGFPAIDASSEPLDLALCEPPFFPASQRRIERRKSPRAWAILSPGGESGPP
jgi:hypothetical protein